jgi:hypothetical protein
MCKEIRHVPPFSEPDVITRGDRQISARWNLGTPTVDGWQLQAILSVQHVKGHGYRAALNTTRFRASSGVPEDDVDPLRSVVIYDDCTAARLSRGGLDAAFAAALMQLWQRVILGDSAVRAHLPAHRSPRVIVPFLVDNLVEGDVFSVDGGYTWYVCAVLLFGAVAVYTTLQRDDESPTIRIDADRDAPCLLLIA